MHIVEISPLINRVDPISPDRPASRRMGRAALPVSFCRRRRSGRRARLHCGAPAMSATILSFDGAHRGAVTRPPIAPRVVVRPCGGAFAAVFIQWPDGAEDRLQIFPSPSAAEWSARRISRAIERARR